VSTSRPEIHRRVQEGCAHTRQPQGINLVLHQRDQRRNDHPNTLA
jgi:hypothetical protein